MTASQSIRILDILTFEWGMSQKKAALLIRWASFAGGVELSALLALL